MNSQIVCCDEVEQLATKQLVSRECTVCWRAVLLNLKLVLCVRSYKDIGICK